MDHQLVDELLHSYGSPVGAAGSRENETAWMHAVHKRVCGDLRGSPACLRQLLHVLNQWHGNGLPFNYLPISLQKAAELHESLATSSRLIMSGERSDSLSFSQALFEDANGIEPVQRCCDRLLVVRVVSKPTKWRVLEHSSSLFVEDASGVFPCVLSGCMAPSAMGKICLIAHWTVVPHPTFPVLLFENQSASTRPTYFEIRGTAVLPLEENYQMAVSYASIARQETALSVDEYLSNKSSPSPVHTSSLCLYGVVTAISNVLYLGSALRSLFLLHLGDNRSWSGDCVNILFTADDHSNNLCWRNCLAVGQCIQLNHLKRKVMFPGKENAQLVLVCTSETVVESPSEQINNSPALVPWSYAGTLLRIVDAELGVFELENGVFVYTSRYEDSTYFRGWRVGVYLRFFNVHLCRDLRGHITSIGLCFRSSVVIERQSPLSTLAVVSIPRLSVYRKLLASLPFAEHASMLKVIGELRGCLGSMRTAANDLCDQLVVNWLLSIKVLGDASASRDVYQEFFSRPHVCSDSSADWKELGCGFVSVHNVNEYASTVMHGTKSLSELDVYSFWDAKVQTTHDSFGDRMLLGMVIADSVGQLWLKDATDKIRLTIPKLPLMYHNALVRVKFWSLVCEFACEDLRWPRVVRTLSYISASLCDLDLIATPPPLPAATLVPSLVTRSCNVAIESKQFLRVSSGPGFSVFGTLVNESSSATSAIELRFEEGALQWYPFIHAGLVYNFIGLVETSSSLFLVHPQSIMTTLTIANHQQFGINRRELVMLEDKLQHRLDSGLLGVADVLSMRTPAGSSAFSASFERRLSFRGMVIRRSWRKAPPMTSVFNLDPASKRSDLVISVGNLSSATDPRCMILDVQDLESTHSILSVFIDLFESPAILGLIVGAKATFHRVGLAYTERTGRWSAIIRPETLIEVNDLDPSRPVVAVNSQEILAESIALAPYRRLMQAITHPDLIAQGFKVICDFVALISFTGRVNCGNCGAFRTAVHGECSRCYKAANTVVHCKLQIAVKDGTGEAQVEVDQSELVYQLLLLDGDQVEKLRLLIMKSNGLDLRWTDSSMNGFSQSNLDAQQLAHQAFCNLLSMSSVLRPIVLFCTQKPSQPDPSRATVKLAGNGNAVLELARHPVLYLRAISLEKVCVTDELVRLLRKLRE